MAYQSRIPADPEYLASVGRAFYNFTYLEWQVIWVMAKVSPDGFGSVPRGVSASVIAKAFAQAIEAASPPLPTPLRRRLAAFHTSYVEAIRSRNRLLHAHPYTASGGAQQLQGGGVEWPVDLIEEAARAYEEAAIVGSAILDSDLPEVWR